MSLQSALIVFQNSKEYQSVITDRKTEIACSLLSRASSGFGKSEWAEQGENGDSEGGVGEVRG